MTRSKPHAPQPTEADVASRGPKQLPIRIITHNVRYAATDLDKNERPWEYRCPLIVNELQYHTRFLTGIESTAQSGCGTSFICLQEVLHAQLCDILCGLNNLDASGSSSNLPSGPFWSHIGIGRDDGKTDGEYSPILYPTRLFRLLHFQTTWLSPTPDKPSKGWDAGNKRILTTGVFEHRALGQRVAVFNTHLDNEGSEARARSVPLMLGVIEHVRKIWGGGGDKGGLQFLFAGDFNSRPNMEAYEAMVASGAAVDAHEAVPKMARYGFADTFTGFTGKPDDGSGLRRIDFVWVGPKSDVLGRSSERMEEEKEKSRSGWRIEGYSTLPNVFDYRMYCSDHRAVVVDAVLCTC